MKRVLVRAGLIYTTANVLSAAVPLVLLPVLTRALEPQEYGEVVNFFLLVTLASSVAGLNVHSAVSVRWFSDAGESFRIYVGSALCVAVVASLISAAALSLASILFADRLGLDPWYWPLAAFLSGSLVIAGMRTGLWQSQAKPLGSAMLQIATASANVLLSLVAVLTLGLGAAGRIGGATLGSALCAVAAVWLLRRGRDIEWSARREDVSKLLRFGLPLVPHSVSGTLLVSSDRFSVAAVLGPDALGIYGAAAQLGMVMNVLGDALVKAMSPWLYRQLAAGKCVGSLRVVGLTYILIPVWLLVAAGLWVVLNVAGPLLLDVRYLAALQLVPLFLLGGAMSSIYLTIAGLYFFTSKTEWLSVATMGSAAAAVLLAPVLVARFGLFGAATAYFMAQAVQLLLSWLLSLRVQPMPWGRIGLAVRALTRTWSRA